MTDVRRTTRRPIASPAAMMWLAAALASAAPCLPAAADDVAPSVASAPTAAPAVSTNPFDQVPEELKGVDVEEHLDARLPLDLMLTDDRGQSVRLGDSFTGETPVILTLNYYRCAGLCTYTLNGLVDAVRELDLAMPAKYRIITISFDATEPWELAQAKREAYLFALERKGAPAEEPEGWRFHVATQDAIDTITQTVGFKYRPQEDGNFAHAAVVILCTPDGRVSRYVYGIQPPVKDVRLAIIEAGEGKVGSAFDRFILWCHRYDPGSKSYVKSAMRIMQLGGVVTLMVLGGGLAILWRMDLRGRSGPTPQGAAVSTFAEGGLQT